MSRKTLAFAGVSILSLATPAMAQSAASKPAAENATVTDEIIVSARRKEESAQDVPLVVNAVTSEAINKLNLRDFKDVASVVPGLTLTPALNGVAPAATIRGVDYQTNNSGTNGTIQFYLNDAPLPANVIFQSLYDVGQIEVLRGPQGTLRGIAAPSGSITVTTRKPDMDQFGGYFSATANTIGTINFNGALNVPIIKGVLALRVAGLVDDDEVNRVHSINAPSVSPFNHSRGERASLRFTPMDSLEINASYTHQLNNVHFFDQAVSANLVFGGAAVGTQLTPQSRSSVEALPLTAHDEYNVYNLQAQYRVAGQKLNYVGNWQNQDLLSQQVGDLGAAFQGFPGDSNASPITAPNLRNFGTNSHSYANTQFHELRLSSEERLFGIFDYVVGGMINRLNSPTDLIVNTPLFFSAPATPANFLPNVVPGAPGFHITNLALRSRSLERSIYGDLTAHIGSGTEISGGIRYIHFNYYSSLTINPPSGFTDLKTTVYSASIKHRFNANIMAYASTGSSWRIGAGTNGIILANSSGNTGPITDPNLADLNGITPETSKSYEAGIKTDWLDKRLHLNVTYYHQDYKNYIFSSTPILFRGNSGTLAAPIYITTLTSNGQAGLATGVPVKVNGVEAEFGYVASHNFNIGGTISYALGRITNGNVPCSINPAAPPPPPQQINLCTVSQRSSPASPFTATLQTEYSHDLSQNIDGYLRGQLTYFGASQNDPTNPFDDIKAYGLVNLFAGVRDSERGWEVTAYVKNLFNTYRALTVNSSPYVTGYGTVVPAGGAGIVTNYVGITSTAPREFGITFRYSFGSR